MTLPRSFRKLRKVKAIIHMKTITAIVAFIAIAGIGRQVRAMPQDHHALNGITVDGIQNIGAEAQQQAPSFDIFQLNTPPSEQVGFINQNVMWNTGKEKLGAVTTNKEEGLAKFSGTIEGRVRTSLVESVALGLVAANQPKVAWWKPADDCPVG